MNKGYQHKYRADALAEECKRRFPERQFWVGPNHWFRWSVYTRKAVIDPTDPNAIACEVGPLKGWRYRKAA